MKLEIYRHPEDHSSEDSSRREALSITAKELRCPPITAIAGLGGVGTWVVNALPQRNGFYLLFDPDSYDQSNVARLPLTLRSAVVEMAPRVKVRRAAMSQIQRTIRLFDGCDAYAFASNARSIHGQPPFLACLMQERLEGQRLKDVVLLADVLIDCTDNVRSQELLREACRDHACYLAARADREGGISRGVIYWGHSSPLAIVGTEQETTYHNPPGPAELAIVGGTVALEWDALINTIEGDI